MDRSEEKKKKKKRKKNNKIGEPAQFLSKLVNNIRLHEKKRMFGRSKHKLPIHCLIFLCNNFIFLLFAGL